MGIYNNIIGNITCPHCNHSIDINEQIKWEDTELNFYQYKVGDMVYTTDTNTIDNVFTYGSNLRPRLMTKCNNCDKFIPYEVIVQHNSIVEIKPTSQNDIDKEIELWKAKIALFKMINQFMYETTDKNGDEFFDNCCEGAGEAAFSVLGFHTNVIQKEEFYLLFDIAENTLRCLSGLDSIKIGWLKTYEDNKRDKKENYE